MSVQHDVAIVSPFRAALSASCHPERAAPCREDNNLQAGDCWEYVGSPVGSLHDHRILEQVRIAVPAYSPLVAKVGTSRCGSD